jgi:hypothetical protein
MSFISSEFRTTTTACVIIGSTFIIGGIGYLLGFWDRVDYKVRELLVGSKDTNGKELTALVAKCFESNIPKHVMRLIDGTKKAIDASHPNSATLQLEAALAYGCPTGCDSLNIFLCFNDPKRTPPGPRWATGWAIFTSNTNDVDSMLKKVNEIKSIPEEIVAVQIGGKERRVLAGRIPWRHRWTPMIAPFFHWCRAFQAYEKSGFQSIGNHDDEREIAMEVYVLDSQNKFYWIDYAIIFGDVKKIWSDMDFQRTRG